MREDRESRHLPFSRDVPLRPTPHSSRPNPVPDVDGPDRDTRTFPTLSGVSPLPSIRRGISSLVVPVHRCASYEGGRRTSSPTPGVPPPLTPTVLLAPSLMPRRHVVRRRRHRRFWVEVSTTDKSFTNYFRFCPCLLPSLPSHPVSRCD